MEGTLEAFGASAAPCRGKPILWKKIEMHFWKARSGVSSSYYLKGKSQGGLKEESDD